MSAVASFESYTPDLNLPVIYVEKVYDATGGNWINAINNSIAMTALNGGTVIFPENVEIVASGRFTSLASHTTLLIPQSCTIVKTNGAYSELFGLAAVTYPALVQDVHIIGGTWEWQPTSDPGSDDQRGFFLFKYGQNVSVTDAVFNCLDPTFGRRTPSGTFQWCIDQKFLRNEVADGYFGVAISAQYAPDNAARVCDKILVADCQFTMSVIPTGTTYEGVFVKGSFANGYNVSNVSVRDCLIDSYGLGIEIGPGSDATIKGNKISNFVSGISCADMDYSRVERNTIKNSVSGRTILIEVTGADHSDVIANRLVDPSNTTAPGIGVYGSSSTRTSNYANIADNFILGCIDSIQVLDNASYADVSNNTARQPHRYGINIGPANASSTNNTVYNMIRNNLIDRPVGGIGINLSTYSTYSTTNIAIVGNVRISASIQGVVNGVNSGDVTGT